ncbi:VOC family protein [Desertimonas flava]|uniref:VOC family protein n=1 Tax=Desertimonas flava TaxID=2064846 RepID=UPI0023F2236F|nr:VOC family protein [Desertimonas flava]
MTTDVTASSTAQTALHHIALVCKDVAATHRFYGELLGLQLVHTERTELGDGYLRHFFYDLGDGSCIAFFELNGVGEPDSFDTAISTGLGLPAWVNHVALRATAEHVAEVRERFAAAGEPEPMVLRHGWSRSTYFTDPNGNLLELCVDTPGFVPDPAEAKRLLLEAG